MFTTIRTDPKKTKTPGMEHRPNTINGMDEPLPGGMPPVGNDRLIGKKWAACIYKGNQKNGTQYVTITGNGIRED